MARAAAWPALIPAAALAAELPESLPTPRPERAAAYQEDAPKSILDLQQFRQTQTVTIEGGGKATLVELNPFANTWFVLTLSGDAGDGRSYHLQNPTPKQHWLTLSKDGLKISDDSGSALCDLWSAAPSPLERASASSLPYAPICGGRLYVRNRVAGRRTELERVSDFLRDHVWQGDAMVGFVRETLYRDAFAESARPGHGERSWSAPDGAPPPASLHPDAVGRTVVPAHLGLDLMRPASGELALGQWYAVRNFPGIFLGLMQPAAVADEIARSHPGRTRPLDAVESKSLDYLIAFDLDQLDLGFVLGTEHPRLEWSARPPDTVRDARLPGPDGIGSSSPLVTTGMVPPWRAGATVAAFTGGFKRLHGAFRYGDLAIRNRGSHYGFIEDGVVFSKLQPGLATLFVLTDGSVHMTTWSSTDDRLLPVIRHARQNGVPLIEPDAATGEPVPGPLVAIWGSGNWSGSSKGELRALRAGVCLLETPRAHFLVYGYFSTATPSAMARVFQAYGCRYAMHLDMNALEHTYLALYSRVGDRLEFQHLIPGMSEVDKAVDGEAMPRFMAFPDNRDFFFLTRREQGE